MNHPSELGLVLWTTDIDGLARFLSEAGGAIVAERHPGFAELHVNGSTIVLQADDALRGHPWHDALRREGVARGIGAEIHLRVADLHASYRRAVALGALTITPPYNADYSIECQVMAPDGFLVTLWQAR